MTRSELISILSTHGLEGSPDPEVLVDMGHPGGEAFGVRFVPRGDGHEAHILLIPDID